MTLAPALGTTYRIDGRTYNVIKTGVTVDDGGTRRTDMVLLACAASRGRDRDGRGRDASQLIARSLDELAYISASAVPQPVRVGARRRTTTDSSNNSLYDKAPPHVGRQPKPRIEQPRVAAAAPNPSREWVAPRHPNKSLHVDAARLPNPSRRVAISFVDWRATFLISLVVMLNGTYYLLTHDTVAVSLMGVACIAWVLVHVARFARSKTLLAKRQSSLVNGVARYKYVGVGRTPPSSPRNVRRF